jgi:hypothetical protein
VPLVEFSPHGTRAARVLATAICTTGGEGRVLALRPAPHADVVRGRLISGTDRSPADERRPRVEDYSHWCWTTSLTLVVCVILGLSGDCAMSDESWLA